MARDYFYVAQNFFAEATALREHYLQRFSTPFHASEERFVWDYWHVPGQYTLIRTPAYHFFPQEIYQQLEEALALWGRTHLGCAEISPPWLSYYIEGCEQQLHADNPHGPWAFVYSLTDWNSRVFSGGETQLLSPKVLDYWRDFDSSRGFERETLLKEIPPLFNQLTVFDPRVPHGVNPVRGVKDPRKARIVIHGWFLEPQPLVSGALEGQNIDESLNENLEPLLDRFEELGPMDGYLAAQIKIEPSGTASEITILTNSLRSLSAQEMDPEHAEKIVRDELSKIKLPQAKGPSQLTLPFVFK